MTARGLSPGRDKRHSARTCSDCHAGASAIARVYHFPVDTLSKYLSLEDFAKFEVIASKAVALKTLGTEYLGVKVGSLALYEFTLAHKKMSTSLTESQWNEYHFYLVNSLRTLGGFERYLEKNRPDAILTFSPQYSNINSAMQYAIKQGIRVYFIESGTNLAHRLGTMRVWDWSVHKLVNPALTYWDKSEVNPVTSFSADKVVGHFKQLLSGRHHSVYSASFTGSSGVIKRWKTGQDQKILLMTLSSYDEAYAALLIDCFPYEKVFSDVFRTQAEWVEATLRWVTSRPDLFLVIRVHPRDFPNKRETLRSEQSFMLENLLKDLPNNAHVNWPAEGISLYELLEDTDVVLTGWSVTAIEALALGIPIVTYDANLPSFPQDIHYTGRNQAEYFKNIESALTDGWRLENAINGFRWLAFNFVTCTVTVSKDFGRFELGRQSLLQRIWSRVKGGLPSMGYSLDLLKWRDAVPGARIVSNMLELGYDALPPARKTLEKSATDCDRVIVITSLLRLHELIYVNSKFPLDKPGLSSNILTLLANENLK